MEAANAQQIKAATAKVDKKMTRKKGKMVKYVASVGTTEADKSTLDKVDRLSNFTAES